MSNLLSKKYIISLFICVLAVVFVFFDKLSGFEAMTFITTTGGLYLGSNVLAKNKV